MLWAVGVSASVVVLTPASINTATGQTFTVTVAVNPSPAQNYAEKVELLYPADVLEVKSFALAPNWIALTQSGYDLTDNTNGVLAKSAGFPSGLSNTTAFGTVTFSAKKAGSGTIKIGNNSLAFEASTQNALTGSGAYVIVSESVTPVVTVTPSVKPNPAVVKKSVTTSTVPAVEATSSNQVASVAKSGFNWNWLWLAVIAVLFLPGVYHSLRRDKKV